MKNRVVVTGLGAITPLGQDVQSTWEGLLAGKSGIARITSFDTTGFDVQIAGEVKGFDPTKFIDPQDVKRQDPYTQFAVVATMEAIKDSQIEFEKCNRDRCGVILGAGIGGLHEILEQNERFLAKGPKRLSPFLVPRMMINAAPAYIAMLYGLRGPNFSTSSACASAGHAIGMALRTIQYGDADIIITGGSESAITYLSVGGFASAKALSTRNDAPSAASRPFDKNRDGFVMAEGAGILILESLSHAKARGAKIYAEIIGFGMSNDAYHITAPDTDGGGAALAIQNALKDANINPQMVSYINSHGTSTQLNDAIETKAIKNVFGDYAYKIPVNSTKSMIGHLLGAAAGIELVVTVLSVKDDIIHPTINYETPDPQCDLDYTPNKARKVRVDVAISNSFGFGGHNSVIVVGKYKGD